MDVINSKCQFCLSEFHAHLHACPHVLVSLCLPSLSLTCIFMNLPFHIKRNLGVCVFACNCTRIKHSELTFAHLMQIIQLNSFQFYQFNSILSSMHSCTFAHACTHTHLCQFLYVGCSLSLTCICLNLPFHIKRNLCVCLFACTCTRMKHTELTFAYLIQIIQFNSIHLILSIQFNSFNFVFYQIHQFIQWVCLPNLTNWD